MSVEIERKYLLEAMPSIPSGADLWTLDQGYYHDSDREIDVRIRRIVRPNGETRYVETIKQGSGLVRTEVERDLDHDHWMANWPLTKGRRVRKERYRVSVGDHVWEIDRFLDRELYLAEVEMESETDEVPLPEWLQKHIVRDVTEEPEYTNKNLAR